MRVAKLEQQQKSQRKYWPHATEVTPYFDLFTLCTEMKGANMLVILRINFSRKLQMATGTCNCHRIKLDLHLNLNFRIIICCSTATPRNVLCIVSYENLKNLFKNYPKISQSTLSTLFLWLMVNQMFSTIFEHYSLREFMFFWNSLPPLMNNG